MKYFYSLSFSLLFYFIGYTQEFQYFATRDGVDIASKYGENAVTLQFRNKNNQKVYVETGDVIWFQGEIMVGKSNGGGLTLSSRETSSSGMFFLYPKGYDSKNYQSLRFKISSLKVEIGGMGNDPRYQNTQSKSQSSDVKGGQGLPEIDFNQNATREPGSNEWKPMPPANEIKFPGDDKSTTQKTNGTQTNSPKPSSKQSPDPNIKMNGLYYSNGTTIQNNGITGNTENANQKQQYQNQANNYLNQAQNTNQSIISQQMNLNLAATNATMAGNTQQLQQIQQIQNQQRQESNQQLANSIVSLGQLIFSNIHSSNRLPRYSSRDYKNDTKAAAEAGDTYGMINYAVLLSLKEDHKGAFYWYEKSAQADNQDGMFELYNCYYYGRQTEKNDSLAMYWLKKSAFNGHLQAIQFVGDKYYKENSCTEKSKALEYYLFIDSVNYKPVIERSHGRIYISDVPKIQLKIADIYASCFQNTAESKIYLQKALAFCSKGQETINNDSNNKNVSAYWKKNEKETLKEIEKLRKEVEKKLSSL